VYRAGYTKEPGLNPLALVTFGTRIGPWLGRTIAADARFLPALLSRLKIGAKFVGSSVGEIVSWAKSNPGNAVMLSTTLASLGFSVANLFGDTKDPETNVFKLDLDKVASKASSAIDSIGNKSVDAAFGGTSDERQVQDEVSIETLSWARGFFGSVSAAVEAHRMLQVFIEMPLAEVQHGFSIYRLR
jgi:hypothetical protein